MAMPIATPNPTKMKFLRIMPSSSSLSSTKPNHLFNWKPVHCAQQEIDVGILCEPCNGKGWLLCDFCEGQKTNVKAANNRVYRRCPSCKAVGYVLCSKCKVFKCITFPNYSDVLVLTMIVFRSLQSGFLLLPLCYFFPLEKVL
ncbi:hypothetical protein QYF36_026251 [Acer negundo]|nr:hypothetical protein QYF36_026251 [Acer negundo]